VSEEVTGGTGRGIYHDTYLLDQSRMGAGLSTGGTSTVEVKNILNTILRDMFNRTDLVDLYSLADPDQCSKYIVVGAKSLEKLFVSINLEPRLGKDGQVFFQKLDGLRKASPLRGEQENTCKMLAFFFIRIFRIYGALALSIIDSELPSVDPFMVTKGQPVSRGFLNPPALQGFQQKKSWFGFGGELTPTSGSYYIPETAGVYKILNKYLIAGAVDSRNDLRFQDYDIKLPQNTLYDFALDGTRSVKTDINPTLYYNFKSGDSVSSVAAELSLTQDDRAGQFGGVSVQLSNVRFTTGDKTGERRTVNGALVKRSQDDETPVSTNAKQLNGLLQELFMRGADQIDPPKFSVMDFFRKFRIISEDSGSIMIEGTNIKLDLTGAAREEVPIIYSGNVRSDAGKTVTVKVSTDVLVSKMPKMIGRQHEYRVKVDLTNMETRPDITSMLDKTKERFSHFYTGEGDTSTPRNSRGMTVPAYLQAVFNDLLKEAENGRIDLDVTINSKTGYPVPYDSDKVPDQLRVKKLWKGLVRDPPVKSHCIARAVQLLNVAAIKVPGTGEGFSSVCRVKFPYINEGSLPEPGKDVLTEDGIHALAMLFIDQLGGPTFTPKITDTPQFDSFRKRMKFLFEKGGSYDTTPVPKDFTEIKDLAMPYCKDHQNDVIELKGGLLARVRSRALALIERQKVHVAQVMQMLFKLFNERAIRAGYFEISDYILQNGMPAINKVAEEARALLIEYYSSCESTYKEGLFDIYNEGMQNPAAIKYRPS